MIVNNTNNADIKAAKVNLPIKKDILNTTNKKIYIFNIYKNNNYKLIPFNVRMLDLASTKYLPPVSKEWKNSIYVFNSNKLKNLPIYDIKINNVIKSYFKSYFLPKYIKGKYVSRYFRIRRMNIVHVSKAEIKHTNSKAILNIFTYNREKTSLWKKIFILRRKFFFNLYKWIILSNYLNSKIILFYNRELALAPGNIQKRLNILKKFKFKLKIKRGKRLVNLLRYNIKDLKKKWLLFRKYKLKFNLNKYKFEERFLYYLSTVVSKYYKKKVEFNFINLKSVIFNSDLFTKVLAIRLRKKGAGVMKLMSVIFNKTKLPKINKIIEKSSIIQKIDKTIMENKYKNTSINYILKEKNLDELLYKIYYNINNNISHKDKYLSKIYDIIFNSIKYKNIGGVRLVVSGRLTPRYRADRAVYKQEWKGKLNNLEASFKGLSCVNKRGYIESNIEYSIYTSKRRIGAFAVKGWISGK